MKRYKTILLLLSIVKANAVPTCSYLEELKYNLVCTPGKEDYRLKRQLLRNTENIKSVSLKACRITAIDCDALQSLSSLQTLDLSENKLQEIKACVFNNLTQLTSLNIFDNSITKLSPKTFDHIPNVERLFLNGNKLNTIQVGLFDKLPKLRTLDLSSNAIDGRSIRSSVFDQNTQITSLDLSRNDMSGLSDNLLQTVQSLQSLYLERCLITAVPKFATGNNMKSLKQLTLTTNRISKLEDSTTFINLDDLELLNIADNSIENIAENIFSPLRKVKTIVLHHNKLKHIPDRLFQNLPKLVSIDLSYNAITNIKSVAFSNTPMKNLNLSGNQLSYLPGRFYDELISSGGMLKKLLFSHNPWQCACFRDIVAMLKEHNIEYNSAKFDGNNSVCVTSNDNINSCIRDTN